jgi:hypothetical protein
MHGSVSKDLETLLSAKPSAAAGTVSNHISNCRECASELDAMRSQTAMLKTLKPTSDIEPSAGFYARVMQRIEQSARRSIWWVFVYSPIGKRLAYASLALTLALGSYVVAQETSDGHLSQRPAIVQDTHFGNTHFDALVTGSPDEQRSAVLENFVAHPVAFQTASVQ